MAARVQGGVEAREGRQPRAVVAHREARRRRRRRADLRQRHRRRRTLACWCRYQPKWVPVEVLQPGEHCNQLVAMVLAPWRC